MKKFFSLFLLLIMVMSMTFSVAFASDAGSGVASDVAEVITSGEVSASDTTDGTTPSGGYKTEGVMSPQEAAGIPDVSTDDLINRIDEKGNDIVNIMQAVGKWACIVVFIVCIILFIVGIIANKKMAVAAFIGMLFAGIGYAGILCGREIVSYIATWAAS